MPSTRAPKTKARKAAPKSKTASSTPRPSDRPPRLTEYARSFVFPATITRTVWPRVEAKGREVGLGFDWWQSQLGTVCLGYRADGKYAATVGGVGMSIPRQVGKTYFVLAMLVILCLLFPGLQVVWTAHHLRTSTKTFTALRGMVRRKKIRPHLKPSRNDGIRSANGEQEVEFANGSKIMFGARAMGFGRGFDEIDIMVFDEAQILDTKSLEDMIAATNQARHEHGALLFYMGTPPRPTDPSEAFTQRRKEARDGESDDAVWLEIGADPESDADDESQWPLMNPSYPRRTPRESLLRLRKNLSNEESWNREGRGIWDDDAATSVFGPFWERCKSDMPSGLAMSSLAVAATFDMDRAAIVGAARDGDLTHVKPLEMRPGSGWIVDRAKAIQASHDVDLVIDPRGPAAVLIPTLEREGVRLRVVKSDQVYDSCSGTVEAVKAKTLRHAGFAELDREVEIAAKRKVGDRWAWDRKLGIPVLEAMSLAWWAAGNESKQPPPPDIF